ncbi:MAG: gluconokinase [Pseudomonadota bacterium]
MIIIVWGVSGCGKSTVGAMLAEKINGVFFDADDYHPQNNIQKMSQGIPLDDQDRKPWLERLVLLLKDSQQTEGHVVLACSALKAKYRAVLNVDSEAVRFVHLRGDFDLIASRLASRKHEFMNNSLLQSQFDTLEEDPGSLCVEVDLPPNGICCKVKAGLGVK